VSFTFVISWENPPGFCHDTTKLPHQGQTHPASLAIQASEGEELVHCRYALKRVASFVVAKHLDTTPSTRTRHDGLAMPSLGENPSIFGASRQKTTGF
jgi:hypothetical protein